MTVYETLKGLALLPAPIVLGLLLGLVLAPWKRRTGYLLLWLATLAFYCASAPYFANRFGAWVESVPPLTDLNAARSAQAIVVLSAGASPGAVEYGGVRLDEYSLVRLRYAAHLQRLLNLPLLASGGPVRDTGTTYAATMKVALEQDFGVPVQWIEEKSRNTAENASESAAILKAAGVQKIVLVTHASHMPRSAALFRATGLEVIPAGTDYTRVTNEIPRDLVPRMSALATSYLAFYEALGQIWYAIRPTS
jgi:uncharacterized SAM-binding protein YcdF (DUF218 family)